MRYHQIPTVIQDFKNIALYVVSRLLGGQKITTPSVMASPSKGISDNSRKFTRN
jgi:hypothetical protein